MSENQERGVMTVNKHSGNRAVQPTIGLTGRIKVLTLKANQYGKGIQPMGQQRKKKFLASFQERFPTVTILVDFW